MKSARCPTCGKLLRSSADASQPFCSPRCREIDLSRWLDEKYVIPGRPLDEEELDEAAREAEDPESDDE